MKLLITSPSFISIPKFYGVSQELNDVLDLICAPVFP
jgi:hypothetical protein